MNTAQPKSVLERLGILFVLLICTVAVAALWMIAAGFLQARSASRNSQALMTQFDESICSSSWSEAYLKMDSDYRAKNDLSRFTASLLSADEAVSVRPARCESIRHRLSRDPDGTSWTAEFDQFLQVNGRHVTNRCTLHSGSGGWVISTCTNVPRTGTP